MLSLPQMRRCASLFLCGILAGCAPLNKYSFETFTPQPGRAGEGVGRSDLLALIYADYVAKLLEGRSTSARITREASDSSLVIGGALLAAKETLKISAETVAHMGVGIVIVRELQGIFNARGRSEAFADAAYLIRQAQSEYRQFNPNPSPTTMTENGAILVARVDAAVYAAQKTLTGRMPGLLDLKQATQPMTKKGADRESSGTPQTMFNAAGEKSGPTGATQAEVETAVDRAVSNFEKRQPKRVTAHEVVPVTPSEYKKKAETFTQQLVGMNTVEKVGPAYKALLNKEPSENVEEMQQAINDRIFQIANQPADTGGKMSPAAMEQLDTLSKAFGR